MGPTDFSTITTPLKKEHRFNIEIVDLKMTDIWPLLIKGFHFSEVKYNRKLDHGQYFYPGVISLQGWLKTGPGGKGILRLIIEILQFIETPELKYNCGILIKEFRNCIKELSYTSHVGVTPEHLISSFVGQEWLIKVKLVLPSKLLAKFNRGPRVLVQFADGLLKNRYIAILDWLSQGTLAPLHHSLIQLLRKRSNCDYTHDQGASIDTIISMYHKGKEAWCFDLSAATDRLPIQLEMKALQCMGLSKRGVDAWKGIIVDIPFYSVQTHTFVKYEVGQGIGAYSSWTTIAVLHHYIVRLAAYKSLGLTSFTDYIILGDDVVIFNSAVAREYKSIVLSLGVGISIPKTISPQRRGYSGVEFASKLILNGIDLSPLPLGILLQNDSVRSLNLWTFTLEKSYSIGGPALSEQVLRCIPSWLDQVSIKDSDFKVPQIREDWLTLLGFFIGYANYRKIKDKLLKGSSKDVGHKHALIVDSLIPETSLNLFLSAIPLSCWQEVDRLLLEETWKGFKTSLKYLEKCYKSPTYFISRILKQENFNNPLRVFLSKNESLIFCNVLNSPFIRTYHDIAGIFRKSLKESAIGGSYLYAIDENGNISFPKTDILYKIFQHKHLSNDIVSIIEDNDYLEFITNIIKGPKVLVQDFSKREFFTVSRSPSSITHITSDWRVKPLSLAKCLKKMGVLHSKRSKLHKNIIRSNKEMRHKNSFTRKRVMKT